MTISSKFGVPVVAAVLLTACTSVVGGEPVPPTAAPAVPEPAVPAVDYAGLLTESEQATVAHHARIRALDPCGYVDPDGLDSLGVLRRFDALSSQQACAIDIVVDRDPQKSLEFQIRVINIGSSYENDAQRVEIDGTEVLENSDKYPGRPANAGVNHCRHLIPFDARSFLLVSVKRRTNDPACTELRAVTAGVLPRLESAPQRSESTKKAFHAISVHDPCAVLTPLGAEHRVRLDDYNRSPWKCQFYLDDEQDHHSVALTMAGKSAFRVEGDEPNPDLFDLDGRPATRDSSPHGCKVRVAVGDPDDGQRYDPVSYTVGGEENATNAVETWGPTCAQAERVASAAVATFLG